MKVETEHETVSMGYRVILPLQMKQTQTQY